MSSKRLKKEIETSWGQLTQLTIQGPIPVIVTAYFSKENKVTIQLASTSEVFGRMSMGDKKFPIHAPIHDAISYGIKPGAEMMLYYPGWQVSRGWVIPAHSEGTEESVTYTPIRHSWAV